MVALSTRRATATANTRALGLTGVMTLMLAAYGVLHAPSSNNLLCFLLILAVAVAPTVLWIARGMPGIPALQVLSLLYLLYFGLPLVRGGEDWTVRDPTEVLIAALTVCGFLGLATVVWGSLVRAHPPKRRGASLEFDDTNVRRLIWAGLSVGILFRVLQPLGLQVWLGPMYSVARAVALTATSLACLLVGYARARGILSGDRWMVALGMFLTEVMLSATTLFLVDAGTSVLAAFVGYGMTAKRIPWTPLVITMAIVSVLQAGKGEIRQRHWRADTNYGNQNSIANVPSLLVEWVQVGVSSLVSNTGGQSVIDRTSLMDQLIQVQDLSPQAVPYLDGETYTHLPEMLVPRFVLRQKTATQVVMKELDVRYGFLTERQTEVTAVGVNVLSEGYANFGPLGIILTGLAFGVLTGVVTRVSTGRTPASIQTLISIAVLVGLMDLEADLSYLTSIIFQSTVATCIFFFALQFGMPQLRGLVVRRPLEATRSV